MNTLLEIQNLKQYFQLNRQQTVHAVDDVSLAIGEREIVGLVGESGSGKSTLGKSITGLLARTAGTVTFRGEVLPARFSTADYRRNALRMQMIFQDPYSSLNPRMTVGESVGETLRLTQAGLQDGKRMPSSVITDKVVRWFEQVGLHADHISRYPHEFSGGQRQRIGIARALISEPEFVVCDEPISALDVSVQAQVINLLQDLQERMGLTLLFIAHDLSMVRYLSTRMAVMYLGTLVEVGDAEAVYQNPQHPYTRLLIGSSPSADPAIERHRSLQLAPGEIPSPVNPPPGCPFAERCPDVMPECRAQRPALAMRTVDTVSNEQRLIACHLY